MSTTFDGKNLFDEGELEIELGSIKRDYVNRAVPGLDGSLGIDLGDRGRQIKQKGSLRSQSQVKLDERIEAIADYLDGKGYTLVTNNGARFTDVRMDSFKVKNCRAGGAGLCCDYEIVYKQLVV